LILTDRSRSRGKSKEEVQENFADELADVLGHVLLAADYYKVVLEEALERKWFKYLT